MLIYGLISMTDEILHNYIWNWT